MTKEFIEVCAPSKKYNIYFKNDFKGLKEAVEKSGLKGRKACIVSDSNVSPLYTKEVLAALENSFSNIEVVTFEAGEKNKTLETISSFYEFFIEKRLDRKTVIIALGGGVCGDMAGFAASSYLRGVSFVQIPTTLLSQVDSSVGGKVGVDFLGKKNVVGAFYQPEFVYINVNTLKSLPPREYSAGMAEVIKYGPIWSKKFYAFIIENKKALKDIEEEIVMKTVLECCEIKADVVGNDEKESGIREILNFGHTIGHAIETVKDFSLLHGECVAIGMVAVMKICLDRNYISEETIESMKDILTYFDLPIGVEDVEVEAVYKQMFFDKKVKDNKIGFVLLKSFGETERTMEVTEAEILSAIEYVTGR